MTMLKKTIFLLLFLFSCGDGESDLLAGKTFNGIATPANKASSECEAWGTPGRVSFKPGGYLLLQEAGKSETTTQTYSLTEDTITLSSGKKFYLSENGESLTDEKGEKFTLE